MTIDRVSRRRQSALLLALVLFGAACGGGTSTTADEGSGESADTSGDGDDGAGADEGTEDPPADTDSDTGTEEETEEEVEPPPEDTEPEIVPVALALDPDPVGSTDPLETVNHLESVLVWPAEGGVAVQFDQMSNGGLRVELRDDAQMVDVFCDLYMSGDVQMSNCSGFNRETGLFLDPEETTILDSADGYAYVVPMMVDASYVSISLGGVTYMAQSIIFSDAPGMVQINPDGSLANEVFRTIGHATALMLSEVLA